MKKLIVPVLLGIVLFLNPFDLSAKSVCWTDGTSFFAVSGGKVNEKPFAGAFISPGLGCHGTIWASIVTSGIGVQAITIEGNLPSPCINFVVEANSPPSLNATGFFDNLEDATSDGAITLTVVNCSSVPTSPLTDAPVHPGVKAAGIPDQKVEN